MLLPDHSYLFGRVISTDAKIGPMVDLMLLYIFQVRSSSKELPGHSDLRPSQLLLPPILTNRKGWTEGLFETIDNVPFDANLVLGQHCFERWNGDYFDESLTQLKRAVEPVGSYALDSFRTIDDAISIALGFDLVPD